MSIMGVPEWLQKLMDIWDRQKIGEAGFYELQDLVEEQMAISAKAAREEGQEEIEKLKETDNMIEVCNTYSDNLDEKIHFDDGYTQALDTVLKNL